MNKQSGKWICLLLVVGLIISNMSNVVFVKAATLRTNKTTFSVEVGDSVKLKVTGAKGEITWASGDKRIARVNNQGKVTGVSIGVAHIYTYSGGQSWVSTVHVTPEFEVDEDTIAEELDNRKLTFGDQKFPVSEEEISEVTILSDTMSNEGHTRKVKAEIYVDKTIATLECVVTMTYNNVRDEWQLYKVSSKSELDEVDIEGRWVGNANVHGEFLAGDTSRELEIDIDDLDIDGEFYAEVSFIGDYNVTDVVEMEGKIDLETGDIAMKGVQWLSIESNAALMLEEVDDCYSLYGSINLSNNSFENKDTRDEGEELVTLISMSLEDEDSKDLDDDEFEYEYR